MKPILLLLFAWLSCHSASAQLGSQNTQWQRDQAYRNQQSQIQSYNNTRWQMEQNNQRMRQQREDWNQHNFQGANSRFNPRVAMEATEKELAGFKETWAAEDQKREPSEARLRRRKKKEAKLQKRFERYVAMAKEQEEHDKQQKQKLDKVGELMNGPDTPEESEK